MRRRIRPESSPPKEIRKKKELHSPEALFSFVIEVDRANDMNELNPLLVNNAGLAIFATIFAEQIGVPLPAAPVLVAAGALVANGAVNPALALGVTFAGCVL